MRPSLIWLAASKIRSEVYPLSLQRPPKGFRPFRPTGALSICVHGFKKGE